MRAASTDPDGPSRPTARPVEWRPGTGGRAGPPIRRAGTYTATLTVTDNRGATGGATRNDHGDRPTADVSRSVAGSRTSACRSRTCLGSGLSYANTSAPPREVEVELPVGRRYVSRPPPPTATATTRCTAPPSTSVFVRVKAQSLHGTTRPRTTSACSTTPTATRCTCSTARFQFRAVTDQTSNLPAAFGLGRHERLHRCPRRGTVCDPRHAGHGNAVRRRARRQLGASAGARCVLEPVNNSAVTGDVTLGQIESTLYRTASTRRADRYLRAGRRKHRHGRVRPARHGARVPPLPRGHDQSHRHDGRLAFAGRAARHAARLQRGFANAFSAMVLNDPLYSDSLGSRAGPAFPLQHGERAATVAGLVQRGVDPVDRLGPVRRGQRRRVSLGYRPMYSVFATELRTRRAAHQPVPVHQRLEAAARRAGGAGRPAGRGGGSREPAWASFPRPWMPTRPPRPTAACWPVRRT